MKTNRILIGLAMLVMVGSPVLRAEESSTPQQVFDGMRESFKADKAKGVHAN
jgi:hypothetical protein